MILNGRMTVKSYNSWSRFKKTTLTLFENFDLCCTQSKDSTFFYKNLGIKNCNTETRLYVDKQILNDTKKIMENRKKNILIFLKILI